MKMSSTLGTALITGASSGIGSVYADRLAKRGYDLVLVARDGQRTAAARDRLAAQYGISVDTIEADLVERTDVLKVEERLRSDPAIVLFVNNAGVGPNGPLLSNDLDYLDRMVALNVVAANRLAVAAAQIFVARKAGAIINTASVVALAPEIFNGTYSATKAFMLSLTESLAADLRDTGVRIQAILPGLTRTEIFDRVGSSMDNLNPDMVMGASDMVDAALAGFDQGEVLTIPSLSDAGLLDSLHAARAALGPHLSLKNPAARYGAPQSSAS
jgi:short-subunit dehydrogenase